MGIWVRPVNAPITQRFNNGANPPGSLTGHPGTDYGAACGTPIGAASSGVVSYAGPASGFGLAISIYHPDENVTTTYGHMWTLGVATGEGVSPGQFIAPVGSNGYSTGCHLHFEVRYGRATFGATAQNLDSEVWLVQHIGKHAASGGGNGNRFAGEPVVRLGSSGQAVKDLQNAFIRLGYRLIADGAFGPQTQSLVMALQGFFKLTRDGVVGPQTWATLDMCLDAKHL